MPESIPFGYCHCGCGGLTAIPKKGNHKVGQFAGVPMRFISGHNARMPGGGRPFEPLENRYEVLDCGYETPCWIWRRSFAGKGYGQMWHPVKRRVVPAHRYFYEHFIELVPADLQIDHLCRIHACVNPAHMEPVTQYVNQQRGANAKLTREQADDIRQRVAAGPRGTRSALAREYGVSWPVVDGVAKGRLWA